MVVSLANPLVQLHGLFEKKKISFDTVVQMLGKRNEHDEASSEKLQLTFLSTYPFEAFCYIKLRVTLWAALVHTVFLSVLTQMFFQLIEFYCNAFFCVEVLNKAEPKLSHILRISSEITHTSFFKLKDLIKIIWLLLSPELSSFSAVCRRGQ